MTPYQVSLQAGWNMFSMPFSNPTQFVVDNPANVLSCFSYDSTTGTYVKQAFTQAGFTQPVGGPPNQYIGYWVFCSAPVVLTVNGDNSAANPIQTSLTAGWNLVGQPLSRDISTSSLQFNSLNLTTAVTDGLIGSQGYLYSPLSGAYVPLSYQTNATFQGFGAAWVFGFQAGVLSATPPTLTSLTLSSTPSVTSGLTVGNVVTSL